MNIVEGGMAAMLTVTANRAVGMDTEVMIMRDRAMSTAMDSDYMPVPTMITIESGGDDGALWRSRPPRQHGGGDGGSWCSTPWSAT